MRLPFVLAIILVLSLGSVHETCAQSSAERPSAASLTLTLDEALALFLKQNLDLLITFYGIDSAKGQQMTARLLPNPTLNLGSFSSFSRVTGPPTRSSELNGTLTQLFELAGKRGYRIQSAQVGTQSAEATFEDTVRQLSFAVKDAYVHVQSVSRHLAIARENVARFTRILEINTLRYNKGYISGLDLLRTRLQVVDFQTALLQAEQELEGAFNDVRLLLALPSTTVLELKTELEFHRVDPELATLQHLALEQRPDIRLKRFTVSQRDADLKLARAFQYPDPMFGAGGSVQGPTGPDNPQQVSLVASVPLPFVNRNQGGIVQADVALRTAEADLKKTVLQVHNEVHVVYRTLLQNRRLVEVYQAGVLEDARASLAIIETAYQRGGVTILDLLDAARTASAIQLTYVDALAAYQRNVFQLESAVGRELPPGDGSVPLNEPSTPVRLTLNDALSLFLKQNLDLLIAQYGIDTAKGQQITARLFANPTLNLGTFSSLSHTRGSIARSTELWGNITQLFELAGKRGYRIESAKFGAQSAEATFEDTVRQLSFAVKDAYFQSQAARRHLAIAQENVARFHRIVDVNTIRLNKGFIPEVDLIRLRLQVVDFQTIVIKAHQELESALNDLRLLLALPPTTTLDFGTELQFHQVELDLTVLQQLALTHRPDIRMKQRVLSQQEADLKLARAAQYPDPTFGPGFTVQGPQGPDNPLQVTLTSSLPLQVFNRNQGGIMQAEVAVRVAESDLKKTVLQVHNEVHVVYRTLLQNRRLVEMYQAGVLDDARSSLTIIENAYQRRGVTILDLLDAARTSSAIQLAYVDALTAYQRNLFQLESAVAHELPTGTPPQSEETSAALRLTLEEALRLFLTQNLDLLMAHYGIESAKGAQMTAHLFPNPTLNVGTMSSFNHATGPPSRSTELWGSLSQLFELAGKRGYRIESAQLGTQSAEATVADTVRQLSFAVKDTYFRVQAGRQHLAIAHDNVDRFTRILEVNTIRLKKGFIAEVDLIRLRVQTVDFQTELIQSRQELESALNDLRLLLALPPTTTLDLGTELTFRRLDPDLMALQQLALEQRPDLRIKRLTLSKREADLKLAQAYRYPDPTFGPGFTIQGPRGPDNPQQIAMVFSIPLFFFNRNQGGIAQADVATRTAMADVRKTLIQTQNDVSLSYRTLVQSRRLVEVYQAGVLDDARSSLSIVEAAYQRGGVTILDLLDTSRTSAAIQLNYVDELTSYQHNVFQLEQAVNQEILS